MVAKAGNCKLALKLLGSGEIDIGVNDSGLSDMNELVSDSEGNEEAGLTWTSIGELVDLTRTGFC